MPMRPGVSGLSSCLSPVMELWMRIMPSACKAHEARARRAYRHRLKQRRKLRTLRPPGQCQTQGLVERGAGLAGGGAHRSENRRKIRALIRSLSGSQEIARACATNNFSLGSRKLRRCAEDNVHPRKRILRQHDVASHGFDEGADGRVIQGRRQQRAEPDTQFCRAHPLDCSFLPDAQLLLIVTRRRAPKMRRIEGLRHLGKAEKAMFAGCVSEPEKMIGERGGGESALAVFAHAGRAVAFG